MPNIGPLEIVVVLIVVLIVFGPKRLPELGRSLGRGIREFRGSVTGEHDDDEKPPALDKGEQANTTTEPTAASVEQSAPVEKEQKTGEQ